MTERIFESTPTSPRIERYALSGSSRSGGGGSNSGVGGTYVRILQILRKIASLSCITKRCYQKFFRSSKTLHVYYERNPLKSYMRIRFRVFSSSHNPSPHSVRV